MIIMGGYSDDLSDHCVFALYKAENFYLAQDRTLVRQSAGKSARQKFRLPSNVSTNYLDKF